MKKLLNFAFILAKTYTFGTNIDSFDEYVACALVKNAENNERYCKSRNPHPYAEQGILVCEKLG